MNIQRRLLVCFLRGAFCLCFAFPTLAWGRTPERRSPVPLTVELASGRRFTAELDVRTDQRQLWLRWNRTSSVLLRPIAWDRVVRAELAGETYSGRELHEAVTLLREVHPLPAHPPGTIGGAILRGRPVPPAPGLLPLVPSPPPGAACRFEPSGVRSLAIEVGVANWDSDVEVDGLLLHIYPLDDAGFVVPVRGTIDVELVGEETGTARSRQPFAVLDRWTEQVCPADFHALGACYKLPFRRVHPEFDLRWAPKGLVHVRLAVPGEGLFKASQSMVRIRPYSALRDRLEQATGRRFLEGERR